MWRSPLAFLSCMLLACLSGCPSRETAEGERERGLRPESAAAKGPDERAAAEAKVANTAADAVGRVLPNAPLPVEAMLGHDPQTVESFLGPPLEKGGVRTSCVRFVPQRTWFHCQHAWQKYADKNGKFSAIRVEYEDGKASAIAWESLPGSGPFDPRQALSLVGLELPGDPKMHVPAEGVTVWSWFNSKARLKIHDREYRAEVSVVDGQWARGKVELILNDHLSADEKARVFSAPPAG